MLVSFIRPDAVRLTKQSVSGAVSAQHPCQLLTYRPEHAVGLHQLVSLGQRSCRSLIGRRVSWPVGRVLCTRLRGPAAIHLGLPLPAASCGLPASIGRAALDRSRRRAALATLPF